MADTIIFDGNKIYVTFGLEPREVSVLSAMLERRRMTFEQMIDAVPRNFAGPEFTGSTEDRRPGNYACRINKALKACDYPLRVGNVRCYGYELR